MYYMPTMILLKIINNFEDSFLCENSVRHLSVLLTNLFSIYESLLEMSFLKKINRTDIKNTSTYTNEGEYNLLVRHESSLDVRFRVVMRRVI